MPTAYYNVRPRYSCGSPALLRDNAIAMNVAESESQSYKYILDGHYGKEAIGKANRLGLRGISESVLETVKGWKVHDLVTDERYLRPYDKRMIKDGWRKWLDLYDYEQQLLEKQEPIVAAEVKKDSRLWWFKFNERAQKIIIWEPKIE